MGFGDVVRIRIEASAEGRPDCYVIAMVRGLAVETGGYRVIGGRTDESFLPDGVRDFQFADPMNALIFRGVIDKYLKGLASASTPQWPRSPAGH